MKKAFLLAALATLTIASCKKDDSSPYGNSTNNSNNGTTQPGINYRMQMVNTSNNMSKSTAGSIVWTGGTANPKQIKFEAKMNNSEIEYTTNNAGQIDLMQLNNFGNLVLPAGTYDEIELKVKLDGDNNSPSLQLNGTFSDGSTTRPVTFVSNENLEIKTEQNNVTIADNTTFIAAIDIDMNALLSGLNLLQLQNAQVTNGTIVISQSSNTALYNMIINNFKNHHHHCEFHH